MVVRIHLGTGGATATGRAGLLRLIARRRYGNLVVRRYFAGGIPLGFTFHVTNGRIHDNRRGFEWWLSFNVGLRYPGTFLWWILSGDRAVRARDLYPQGGNYIRYLTVGTRSESPVCCRVQQIPNFAVQNNKTFESGLSRGLERNPVPYLVARRSYGFGIGSPDQLLGNGEWGTGDSSSVRRWCGQLRHRILRGAAWLGVDVWSAPWRGRQLISW